jgi:hypothetical protein
MAEGMVAVVAVALLVGTVVSGVVVVVVSPGSVKLMFCLLVLPGAVVLYRRLEGEHHDTIFIARVAPKKKNTRMPRQK